MFIFFSFFFLATTIKIFKIKPFFFIPIWQSRRKIQEHTFLCIYCSKIKNSTRTLPYDFVFNNSKGYKNSFFLIYMAENNQEKKTNQETKDTN